MNKKLYLGSQSHSRQELLKTAGFEFEVVYQDADEQACDWGLPLQKLLESIAIQKMQHLILPDGKDGDSCFVITADTMGMDVEGNISGKPLDRAEAIEKLKSYRAGAQAGTGMCIDRKKWIDGAWVNEKRILSYAGATYVFDVPDKYLEQYLDDLPKFTGVTCTQVSGGVAIEGYGNRFLKFLDGSYTAVVGLPLYEVQQSLEALGFFD